MHSSHSNILTQCPGQTCLLSGSHQYPLPSAKVQLLDLPVRLPTKKRRTRRTKPHPRAENDNTHSTSSSSGGSSTTMMSTSSIPTTKGGDTIYIKKLLSPNQRDDAASTENIFKPRNRTLRAARGGSKTIADSTSTQPNYSFPTSSSCSNKPPTVISSRWVSKRHHLVGAVGASGDGLDIGVGSSSSSLPSSLVPKYVHSSASDKVRCIALPLLKQRLGYLWEKRMFTDVVFIVGRNKTKIEAHRVILASSSEIFQSLLYNEGKPLISEGKFILYEDDFSEPAFEVFVKAMYTNEIPICLTLALALEVFYATKKYAVIFLEDQVLDHIRQLLAVSNVFEALRFSTSAVELSYLAPICWKIIEDQTSDVVEYHMEDLDAHTFARILERDRLNMDEVELFQAAVRWAASMCKHHGMKTTGKNKRHFMDPLIKHFRFTTMTPNQFTEVVAPSRVLDPKEVQQVQGVFSKVIDARGTTLPYKIVPRVNTSLSQLKGPLRAGQEHELEHNKDVPKICSDSAVVSPSLASRIHSKRISTKKPKRMLSSKGR